MKVVAVASKLHGMGYVEDLVDSVNRSLKPLGVKLERVIIDEKDLADLGLERILVVFVLTGGTSRLIRRIYSVMNSPTLILISHPYHNSMPSALSARSRLEVENNSNVVHFHLSSFSKEEIEKTMKTVLTYEYLKGLKVVLAGEVTDEVKEVKKIVNEVHVIGVDELGRMAEEVRVERKHIKELLKDIDTSGTVENLLTKPLSLYIAIKKILASKKANSFAIDCFPFILKFRFTPCLALSLLLNEGVPAACEGDLRSLILLSVAQRLTSQPGWIFNPSDYNAREHVMVGAHCTVATKLTSYATLLPHFESGNPYAVSGVIAKGVYTIASISPNLRRLAATRAEVVASGTISGGRCRTQAVMRLYEEDPRPFTEKAISNHHVMMKGDVVDELRVLSKMLGMKFIHY